MRQITEKTFYHLAAYLKEHELDIFVGENDFGDLFGAFKEIIGSTPDDVDSILTQNIRNSIVRKQDIDG